MGKEVFNRLLLLWIFSVWHVVSAAKSADLPKPLVVSPTQYWDGNDGPWSTFWATIGTPGNSVRLLPSTSSNAIWPVLPEGCTKDDPAECRNKRGEFFYQGNSSTFENIGLYQLAITVEQQLGYSGNSSFGHDSVKLGLTTETAPVSSYQIVEGIATKDFYLGTIGLSPNAINISSFGDPNPSFMTTLKDQKTIPSLSWGYTAGASYAQPPVFGSLTLGGYDAARSGLDNVSFPFGPDTNRELLVHVASIHGDKPQTALLTKPIYMLLDSLVPHIWLPEEACQAFEAAFGLSYNESANQYFVNDDTHEDLKRQNSSVTFSLESTANTTARSLDITLQYANFDLKLNTPKTGNHSRYFPLRQAQNESQYILGRTFFQEAYITADYERRNFSVAQAVFPDVSNKQTIVTITPAGFVDNSESGGSSSLSPGIIAGIAVGGVVFIVVVLLAIWWWSRKRSRTAETEMQEEKKFKIGQPKAELTGQGLVEAPYENAREKSLPELPNAQAQVYELYSSEDGSGRHEMYAGHDRPELRGNSPLSMWRDSKTLYDSSGAGTPK